MDWAQVPNDVVGSLRKICRALPEAQEQQPWNGFRWTVRRRNFCQVWALDEGGDHPKVMIMFRSNPPELDALRSAGHPFFAAGWGNNVMCMIVDDGVDWDEVAELLTDSYCIMAPKKLAALITAADS